MWSSSVAPGSERLANDFSCAACNVDFSLPANLAKHIFAISIKDFQDAYTFDVKKLMKCCVEIATPDGRLIPFCSYNAVGYREEIRTQLIRSRMAERQARFGAGSNRMLLHEGERR